MEIIVSKDGGININGFKVKIIDETKTLSLSVNVASSDGVSEEEVKTFLNDNLSDLNVKLITKLDEVD